MAVFEEMLIAVCLIVFVSTTCSIETNLAQNKKAYMTSHYSGRNSEFKPDYANDDNADTYAKTTFIAFPTIPYPLWWVIDLEREYRISSMYVNAS